jgi:hypothetical protein
MEREGGANATGEEEGAPPEGEGELPPEGEGEPGEIPAAEPEGEEPPPEVEGEGEGEGEGLPEGEGEPAGEPVAATTPPPPEVPPEAPPKRFAAEASGMHESSPTTEKRKLLLDELNRKKPHRKYAAEGSADGSGGKHPSLGTASVEGGGPAGEGSVEPNGERKTEKYSKMEERLARLEAERVERIEQSRDQILQRLRYHRAFDVAKEVERCRYSKMSDDQFADHCQSIEDNYLRTDCNAPFPVMEEGQQPRQKAAASNTRKPERYTKEAADQAVKHVVSLREKGKAVRYEDVLEAVLDGKPLPE